MNNAPSRPVTLSNGLPAYTRAKPRLRQSEIDRAHAWKQSDIRELRNPAEPKRSLFARIFKGVR